MPSLENYTVKISVSKGRSLGKMHVKEKTWRTFGRMFLHENLYVDQTSSFAQYAMMDRDEQGHRKMQAGNWMPALFANGVRRGPNQLCRTMVVFDLDYVTLAQLESIRVGKVLISQFAWLMHTTRSHCPENPRVRMAIPCDREMTLEEANAVSRYAATMLAVDPEEGIEIPDTVSMKSNQIMYLPSISKDQEYWTDENDGQVLCVDDFLANYPHWKDHALLPRKESEKSASVVDPNKKMEDPRDKPGLIGAFCCSYDIQQAIEEFLPEVYAPSSSTGTDIRYTYLLGSGSNGAVIYDNGLLLHSHHGTDPIEGTANAWDMVRIHKFGHLDKDSPANTLLQNLPSSQRMIEFARANDTVSREMLSSRVPDDDWDDDEKFEDDAPVPATSTDYSTNELLGNDDEPSIDDLLGEDDGDDEPGSTDDRLCDEEPEEKENPHNWQSDLILDKQDKIEKSLHNCVTIVKNSKRIAPAIALNDLDGGPYLRGTFKFPKANLAQAPVPNMVDGRRMTDNDTAALMCALAAPQKMGGYATPFTRQDVELSLLQAAEKNRYNPFMDKVRSLEWDGVTRLATFFHDWFLSPDSPYHTELATVWFVAGITRQYEPGHRFDLVPILGGKQGGGKTGAIEELGMGYGGSLSGDFHDTQAMTESTKGKTVLEVPELKGLSKSMIEDVKHYFTATKDTVRLAYRRNEEDFFRRCVYMGTTNQSHYLRDEENRRFCPVQTQTSEARKIDFKNFLPLIPQFWAEAHHIYLQMRKAQPHGMLPLFFTSKEAKVEAKRLQTESRETMPYEPVQEVVERWLNTPMSAETIDVAWTGNQIDAEFDDKNNDGAVYLRNLVTVTMIREELAHNPIVRELRGAHADKTISQALQKLPDWQQLNYVHRLGRKARWYCRAGGNTRDEFIATAQCNEPSLDDLLS